MRSLVAASLLSISLTACPKVYVGESQTDASTGDGSGGGSTGASTGGSPGGTSDATTGDATTGDSTTGDVTTGDSGTDTGEPLNCAFPAPPPGEPASPDVAPECACVDDMGKLSCESPLCPVITGDCLMEDFGECIGGWDYDEAAIECALLAARDGTPGTLRWYRSANGGYSYHSGFFHIVEQRRVIRQSRYWVDLGGDVSDTVLWQMRDAAHFDGCLALTGTCERIDCLFSGMTDTALSLCLPGFVESYDGP
jgi:hypothetical protein